MPVVRFALRVALFALPVVAYVAMAFALYRSVPHHPYQVLQAYQEAKLTPDESIEVVFVGDSSLGNAIDTRRFTEATGRESVSLALTGRYGLGGAYGMARRAMEAFPNAATLVVMLSPETFRRPESPRGLVLTTPLAEIPRLGADVRGDALADAFALAVSTEVQRFPFDLAFGRSVDRRRLLGGEDGRPLDYPRQSGSRAQPEVTAFGEVPRGKADGLAALRRLAEANGRRVVYVHGPYWEDQLRASGAFLEAAARELTASGVTFVPEPVGIPTDRLGDAADHVAPESKAAYTARYAEVLAPYLEEIPVTQGPVHRLLLGCHRGDPGSRARSACRPPPAPRARPG
ncbi:MAG: hypothetical protein AAF791_15260 [Bacteroidota bacterium]